MKHVAVVVSSRNGQTVKIAECLRSVLEEFDQYVRLFVVQSETDLSLVRLEQFDAVIIGAPVYVGSFPPILVKWVQENCDALNRMPTAFFSVSLNASDKRPEARHEDSRMIADFLEETGLSVLMSRSLIGAVRYRRYGFFKRLYLRRLAKELGAPTNATRNYELTDWSAVKDFAMQFADCISGAPKISAFRYMVQSYRYLDGC